MKKKDPVKQYQFTVSESQLKAIQQALELTARIKIGQVNRLINYAPLKDENLEKNVDQFHSHISALTSLLNQYDWKTSRTEFYLSDLIRELLYNYQRPTFIQSEDKFEANVKEIRT